MTLTYSKADIGTINPVWIADRDAENKDKARTNYGTTPNVPANIMLKIAERIWRKRARG